MKRDGFIASSILYSFFLVFITLFIALIINYIHNQVLINTLDEASWEMLLGINNTKISDLEVGEHIKFAMQPGQQIMNENATWTVAYIEENGDDLTYYFFSDLTAQNLDVYYKLTTDRIIKWHPITIDVYNDLQSQNAYNAAVLYPGVTVTVPTTSIMEKVRAQDLSGNVFDAIYGVDGDYIVYVDNDTAAYTKDRYYEVRTYRFDQTNQSILNSYCNGTFNGDIASYNANNTFGYMNVVRESVKNEKYIDYCSYASPVAYTHSASDNVVDFDENATEGDLVVTTYTSLYTLRLMASLTVNRTDTDTYLAGGKGTSLDPYLLTNGVKQ